MLGWLVLCPVGAVVARLYLRPELSLEATFVHLLRQLNVSSSSQTTNC